MKATHGRLCPRCGRIKPPRLFKRPLWGSELAQRAAPSVALPFYIYDALCSKCNPRTYDPRRLTPEQIQDACAGGVVTQSQAHADVLLSRAVLSEKRAFAVHARYRRAWRPITAALIRERRRAKDLGRRFPPDSAEQALLEAYRLFLGRLCAHAYVCARAGDTAPASLDRLTLTLTPHLQEELDRLRGIYRAHPLRLRIRNHLVLLGRTTTEE